MLRYFNSKGFEALRNRPLERVSISSMGFSFGGGIPVTPTAVRYCCDEAYRNWVDNGAKSNISNDSLSLTFESFGKEGGETKKPSF